MRLLTVLAALTFTSRPAVACEHDVVDPLAESSVLEGEANFDGFFFCAKGAACAERSSRRSTLRIMVAATDEAVADVGTPLELASWGQSRITEVNAVMGRSRLIDVRAQYAGLQRIAFDLEGWAQSLAVADEVERRGMIKDWVRNQIGTGASQLGAARQAAGADVVAVVLSQDLMYQMGICGVAANIGTPSNADPENGYFLIMSGACDNKLSFTHELGHLLGATHGDGTADTNGEGWVTDDGLWRTMTGNGSACDETYGCDRVPVFSNPVLRWFDPATQMHYRVGDADHDNRANVAEMAPLISAYL